MLDIPLWGWFLIVAWSVLATAWIVIFLHGSRLAERNDRLEHHVEILHDAVSEAGRTFQRYATIHSYKKTQDGEAKAIANRRLEQRMKDALNATGYRPLSPSQHVLRELKRRLDSAGQ